MRSALSHSLLWLIAGYSILAAQDNTSSHRENRFSIIAGLSEYQTKEFTLNKVKHRGIFPSLAMTYRIPSDSAQHNIELQLLFNQLSSAFESEAATFASRITLNYSYLQKALKLSPGMQLHLGGSAGADYNVSYFENWDESHFYWLTQYYLAVAGNLCWRQSSTSQWQLELHWPLLALVSRPAERFKSSEVDPQFSTIAGDIHNDLQWATLNRHLDLRLSLQYTFALTDALRPTLIWRFSYLNNRLADTRQLTILTHTIGIVFTF